MFCRSRSILASNGTEMIAHPLRCKCWKCEYCRDWLRHRVMAIAASGNPTTLLTLTTNPAFESDPDQAAHNLIVAFRQLIRVLRRNRPPHSIEYLAIWERTKRGMPHLHVLLRAPYLPQSGISKFMNNQIGAPIVDIRKVKSSGHVIAYVAKYLSKDPADFAGRQHYFYTRHYQQPPTDESEPYQRRPDLTFRMYHLDIAGVEALYRYNFTITHEGDSLHGWRRYKDTPGDLTIEDIEEKYGFRVD